MAAFTTTETQASSIPDAVITLWRDAFVYGATPELVVDQCANLRQEINGTAIHFTKFTNMAVAVAALTETDDPASVALAETDVLVTPHEQGNVVTTTNLANIQSGKRLNMAAGFLVGRNAGASLDNLGITALEAFSTTRIYPNAATAVTNLAVTDTLDKTFANRLYNKLARLNVPGLMGGSYVGIAHDDVLHDLRTDASQGGWIDANKYASPDTILRNEVGMYAGIRWLRSSNVTVTADSNGTIDSYKINVLGFNALGKAESQPLDIRFTGPFDKLGRFINIGWYWVGAYAVIDTANMVQGLCASSVGANS